MITPSAKSPQRRLLLPLNPITSRGKSKPRGQSFNIYNPDYLQNSKNEFEIDNLKETIIKLKTEVRQKKKEIYSLRMENTKSEAELYKHLADIEKILSKINDENVNQRIKGFLNDNEDDNNTKSKEKSLASLLKEQKKELSKRLSQKDEEIHQIKTSEKGFKFLNMNDKMLSRNEELERKQKEFDDLKGKFEVLQYRFNYEYENKMALKKTLTKNKLKIESIAKRNEKLSKENEAYEIMLNIDNGNKSFSLLKREEANRKEIERLNKQIEVLCSKNEENEEKIENYYDR